MGTPLSDQGPSKSRQSCVVGYGVGRENHLFPEGRIPGGHPSGSFVPFLRNGGQRQVAVALQGLRSFAVIMRYLLDGQKLAPTSVLTMSRTEPRS